VEINLSSPDALFNLLLSGESQQIYHAIQYEADLCLEVLQRSEHNKEIDSNKTQSLRRQVKDNLEEASTLRFTLNSIDKKIQHEQNSNPVLRQISGTLKETGLEYTIGNLVDSIGDFDINARRPNDVDFVAIVQNLLSDSLKQRIDMAWCYDDILEAHRSVLVANMINIAHRLTEVALLLQDSRAIQEVRSMLKSLNLDVPSKVRIPNIQASPMELKKILQDGIASMQKTHEDIHRLDNQRKEMKKAVKRLNEKLGEDTDNPPIPPAPISPSHSPGSKSPGKGMVFPTIRRRSH
jgi:hypothetical protein